MNKSCGFYAILMLTVLLISVAQGAIEIPNTKIAASDHAAISNANILALKIGPVIDLVTPVETKDCTSKNRVPAKIFFDVIANGKTVCGLERSNFQFTLIKEPGTTRNVEVVKFEKRFIPSPFIDQYVCFFYVEMAPAASGIHRVTWTKGLYTIKIDYIKDGRILATKNIDFSINE